LFGAAGAAGATGAAGPAAELLVLAGTGKRRVRVGDWRTVARFAPRGRGRLKIKSGRAWSFSFCLCGCGFQIGGGRIFLVAGHEPDIGVQSFAWRRRLQFQITHADGRGFVITEFIEKIYELLVVGKDSDVLDLLDKKASFVRVICREVLTMPTPLCADCDWMCASC